MRDLKVVGLDVDGRHIICEDDGPGSSDGPTKFRLRLDDRLRAAVRGDASRVGQTQIDIEVRSVLRPKEIQARIRAGASVEQLAEASGADPAKIERFAHPVLLERARAAELATAAHPVLADGPAVLTLLEAVTTALVNRGLNPDNTNWDAWRNEDGRWTVQLAWKAGRSDNVAHFRYVPGAHGGTVTALDDTATELIDPDFDRPLRPVAPLAQLAFEGSAPSPAEAAPTPKPQPAPDQAPPARAKRGRPAVPAWEDVLLGVRSSGDR
ncbi:septation protein SepH [[Mycobacterium] wendilense]|uniref:Septation protein SepH n=1 Tax=[Mycobacterium] wendilense TaxID=3064284 RepID=A0ABM9M9V5_9MYCO|nr:septation protein SepH [Mycolicibacterium sp. MU0050]CAJ1579942.1 septation protein SepH [Mycolicibacterium sp. MU0050]